VTRRSMSTAASTPSPSLDAGANHDFKAQCVERGGSRAKVWETLTTSEAPSATPPGLPQGAINVKNAKRRRPAATLDRWNPAAGPRVRARGDGFSCDREGESRHFGNARVQLRLKRCDKRQSFAPASVGPAFFTGSFAIDGVP